MPVARLHRALTVIAVLYVAAMGFSLVYLGEHYVIDVLAGIVTAVVAWKLANAWQKRLAQRLLEQDVATVLEADVGTRLAAREAA